MYLSVCIVVTLLCLHAHPNIVSSVQGNEHIVSAY